MNPPLWKLSGSGSPSTGPPARRRWEGSGGAAPALPGAQPRSCWNAAPRARTPGQTSRADTHQTPPRQFFEYLTLDGAVCVPCRRCGNQTQCPHLTATFKLKNGVSRTARKQNVRKCGSRTRPEEGDPHVLRRGATTAKRMTLCSSFGCSCCIVQAMAKEPHSFGPALSHQFVTPTEPVSTVRPLKVMKIIKPW